MTLTKNPPIILLHGWGNNIASWSQNIEPLRNAGFDVINMELPGFDLAEPNFAWGVPEYAKYVHSRIKKMGIEGQCILMGHSFGGRIAIYLASQYPNEVCKLVLTDAAGVENRFTPKIIAVRIMSFGFKLLDKVPVIRNLSGKLRQFVFGRTASSNYKKASPMMREVLKKVVAINLKSRLKHIKATTLIIWGDKDTITTSHEARTLHKGIKNSKLVWIEGAQHHGHITHHNEWNYAVINFLTTMQA